MSATEEWAGALTLDVNAWATGTSVNSVRYGGATSGTHTAALLAGGVNDTAKVAVTETWNGSSWTEVGDLNTARRAIGGIGISTAALATCGYAGAITNINESWNGSAWTETTDLNTSKTYRVGAGTQTAGIVAGGLPAGGNTETWNGSAWTEVNDMNTGRYAHAGGGTQTALLVYGGEPSRAITEDWDGISWAEVADLNTGRDPYGQGTGTSTNNLCIGGWITAATAATEEWSQGKTTKTVDTD